LLLLKGVAVLGDKIFVKTIQDICKLSGASLSLHDPYVLVLTLWWLVFGR